MMGYYKDAVSTQEVLFNGWLYTGDMAYMDEERYIYPEEKRCNYFWGENIYPMQIENFYRKLPNICDVAILGILNSRMGKIVAAVIEFDDNCSYTKKTARIQFRTSRISKTVQIYF